jgi:hypothetical protein
VFSAYRLVERNFLVLNLGSYLLASFFFFFTFLKAGLNRITSLILVLMASSLPVYMRIYFGWPVMVDPLYFLFVAMFLFFLSYDRLFWAAFAIGMGSLASEKMIVLLIVLYFYGVSRQTGPMVSKCLTNCRLFLPLIPFVLLYFFPIFPNIKPFEDIGANKAGLLWDYLYLILFHIRRYSTDSMWLKQILVYFNCFGAFLYILILFYRDTIEFIKSNKYWIPFVCVTVGYSFCVDRYVIGLLPFVLSCLAYIVRKNLHERTVENIVFGVVVVAAQLIASRFFYTGLNHHGLYRYVTGQFNIFTTQLQVEYQTKEWLRQTLHLQILGFLIVAAAFAARNIHFRNNFLNRISRKCPGFLVRIW